MDEKDKNPNSEEKMEEISGSSSFLEIQKLLSKLSQGELTIFKSQLLNQDKSSTTGEIRKEMEESSSKSENRTPKQPEAKSSEKKPIDDINCLESTTESVTIPPTKQPEANKDKTSSKPEPKEKKHSIKECINPKCNQPRTQLFKVPEFALNFYHVAKKPTKQYICEACFDNCIEKFEEAHHLYKNGQSIFKVEYPEKLDLVEISDSDEEDEEDLDDDENEFLTTEEMWLVNDHLDEIIDKIVDDMDPKVQFEMAESYLKMKVAENEVLLQKEIETFNELQKKSTAMYNQLSPEKTII